jgi:P27 family predicted phage terminase small subunit
MSPKARPYKLKLLEGSRQGRDSGGRKLVEAPRFLRLPPTKPADLSELASELWDLIVDESQRLEILKPIDGAALTFACETWATGKAAQLVINQHGMTFDTSTGNVRRRPEVGIVLECSREFRAWCADFGLTPSAESKLGGAKLGPEGDDDNPFA